MLFLDTTKRTDLRKNTFLMILFKLFSDILIFKHLEFKYILQKVLQCIFWWIAKNKYSFLKRKIF